MSREQQLAEGLKVLGIELSASVQAKLLAYAAFLEKWNHAYSLTALRDPKLAVSHHLLDSLAILPYVRRATCSTLAAVVADPAFRWRSSRRNWR